MKRNMSRTALCVVDRINAAREKEKKKKAQLHLKLKFSFTTAKNAMHEQKLNIHGDGKYD